MGKREESNNNTGTVWDSSLSGSKVVMVCNYAWTQMYIIFALKELVIVSRSISNGMWVSYCPSMPLKGATHRHSYLEHELLTEEIFPPHSWTGGNSSVTWKLIKSWRLILVFKYTHFASFMFIQSILRVCVWGQGAPQRPRVSTDLWNHCTQGLWYSHCQCPVMGRHFSMIKG